MSHFRDRIILEPGNIPQLLSGKVRYSIGAYRIGVALQTLDAACAIQQSAATANVAGNTYSINASADLATLVPTQTVSAHSP